MLHSGIIDQAGRTLPRWPARPCTDATATFARIAIDAALVTRVAALTIADECAAPGDAHHPLTLA